MSQPNRMPALALLAVAAALCAQTVQAQSQAAVRQAAQRALQFSPDVANRLHNYLAQGKAVEAAGAAWKPRLDLQSDAGVDRQRDVGPTYSTIKSAGVGLTVTQLLWDGMAATNETARARHERLARWFEFVEVTENTALEAARAVYDVQRQRRLVQIAEASLANHRNAVGKLDSRVRAGVGRGVDLDQARARLALAESNLETDLANLHEVALRHQRVVGEAPTADTGPLELMTGQLPGTALEAVQAALARSPAIAAGIEGMRAARSAEAVQRSAFQPRIEARANAGGGHNYQGVEGRRADGGVALVLNWNLYNGGADSARVAQQQSLVNAAAAQRDKACTEVRQNVLSAFHDVQKLGTQIATLERNTVAIERARDAYLQQFEIGQRSLLDLLNAENEAFAARRALVNAEYDRAVAQVRVHAAVNQLNAQLGLSREGNSEVARGWAPGEDLASRCPAQTLDLGTLRPAALAPAVPAMASTAAQPATLPTPAPTAAAAMPMAAAPARAAAPAAVAALAAPVAVAPVLPTAAQTRPAPAGPGASQQVAARVESWARFQRAKDMTAFSALYMPEFAGDEGSPQMWRAKQLRQFSQRGVLSVKVSGLTATELPDGAIEARFRHIVSTPSYREASDKVQVWKRVDGQWRIAQEVTL